MFAGANLAVIIFLIPETYPYVTIILIAGQCPIADLVFSRKTSPAQKEGAENPQGYGR